MSIVWSPTAIADLVHLRDYIADRDGPASRRMVARVVEAAEGLADFPASGRPGRVPHTRELVVTGTPYLIPYTVDGRDVHILAVLHSGRKWPAQFP